VNTPSPAGARTPHSDHAARAGGELFRLEDVAQERGGRRVLTGVSLTIPRGGITALVGPSGAGKTSLLRLLNRLDDPTSGTVQIDDAPITSVPIRALRRRVGFVFQAPTMFPGTVADNLRIAESLGAERNQPAMPAASIDDALSLVELSPREYASRDATQLSGGEQQRVSIARALTTRPDVLLMDEPTSALDPEVAERLMATVARLARERGITVVMVTHRLAEARETSTYTVMLEAGVLVECGPTEQLFASASQARTREYLGSSPS
jgi:putative ABC transport system ATP-binding protein